MMGCCDRCDSSCAPQGSRQLYQGLPFLRTPLCCSPAAEDERLLALLMSEAAVYAAAHGLMMFTAAAAGLTTTVPVCVPMPVPCTLLPTPFPRLAYERLQTLAAVFNALYERVSSDYGFLSHCLAETAQVDPFIARLLRIADVAHNEGERQQSVRLCINRSDYMLHAQADGSFTAQQVEFNTIAAGMACLSSRVSEMHAYLISRHVPHYAAGLELPVNAAMQRVVRAMASACELYESQAQQHCTAHQQQLTGRAAVLMVVQQHEWNVVDQQLLAFTLWTQHQIPTLRRTLAELHDEATTDVRGQLMLEGRVVALVYFRAGYSPLHFPSEDEWSALLQVERSLAVKCPTVAYHLAGCKRIQQHLSSASVLERFLSADDAALARSCFASLWALDAGKEETRSCIQAALADPTSFVLKPQREGGGNNLWGEQMVEKLSSASADQLAAYILMRRIVAPAASAAGVRQGQLLRFRGVSEMGIFGVYLSDGGRVHVNAAAGYLLRTKAAADHEGGISAGSGFLDSAVLM